MDAEPTEQSPANEPQRQKRGFALLTPEQRRAVAAQGGRAAHELGTARKFTPDQARAAGRKGGAALSKNRDHAYMVEIGRRGGLARSRRQSEKQPITDHPSREDGWPKDRIEFGMKVMQERKRLGMTLVHLGALARVSHCTLRDIERGLHNTSPSMRRRIIRRLSPFKHVTPRAL